MEPVIIATPNYEDCSFTLRSYRNGQLLLEYRTRRYEREVFEEKLRLTSANWHKWLRRHDVHYCVTLKKGGIKCG